MEFIDLKAQYSRIKVEIDRRIKTVLEHGKYIMGPEIFELEEKLADFIGVKHCIALSSGTDALLIAMMALGIKAGDEVITTPFSFIATAETIVLLGAKPIFVDIDPETCNIDPAKIEAAITDKTKLIMPVSLYGQCADFDTINAIAAKYHLPVIEDGAQSFGATYKGKKSCGLSTIGATSFFPSKPLGGYGDSGACFTNDDELASKMKQIRVHGQDRRYHHALIGVNARMDTLQAAVLLAKLEIFPDEIKARQVVANTYSMLLKNTVITPAIKDYNSSVFAQYTLQVDNREKVREYLESRAIPTAVHYPIPLNLQPALINVYNFEQEFPCSEAAARKVLSLPMHPYLEPQSIKMVAEAVIKSMSDVAALV